ncbi:iron-containing alcohol dehydrogenase [Photobacterium nomapromontoriensis]|uniref:iron-containing alcohol dehydrogenase n=1 Tax=Photobacterium nomapromontoriensis TaxID=2910237 RepID=UPI003D0EE94D
MAFSLKLPKLSIAGEGAVQEAIGHLSGKNLTRAFIVTDKQLVDYGVLDTLFKALDDCAFEYDVFEEVTPNPTATLVHNGARQYQDHGCDCFIAVGGGSAIDCAKAVRVITSCGGDISEYEGIGKVPEDGDFFIAINTTAGTSAEMTSNSVITDEARQVKMVIIDDHQIPDIAVNDPTLMLGLPANVTAATGMDALTHAIEAYVSVGSHTLTKPTALEAIRLITEWLPVAVDDGLNLEAREQLACAQFLAGMAFNSAGLGLVHAMAHQPGATHNLPHGVCNAILLPHVCRFNAQENPQPFADIAKAMGSDVSQLDADNAADECIKRIFALSERVGIPVSFAAMGVDNIDIQQWVGKALNDPCLGGNPRVPSDEQIHAIYQQVV